jgi:2-oxoglutarate ferredoxin oxidoreductase subunit beta
MSDFIDRLPASVADLDEDAYILHDYEGAMSRWCHGCGDNAILTALQKLCAEEQLPPERTVFVSGIGCASRLPHYMGTYGFHGLHGRALPLAEGIKIKRPDLHVFVNTGDGDCCSIGAGHWLHAVRYNMNMTVIMHDNRVYGLTKNQVSPTSPKGLRTNTSPRGAPLEPLNALSATLGMSNISFVAQAVDWLPAVLYDIIHQAFLHRGLSFVSILQRCPHYLPGHFDPYIKNPERIRLLTHPNGIYPDEASLRRFSSHEEHDPSDLGRARALAEVGEKISVGILYRDDSVPCYEDLHRREKHLPVNAKIAALEREFDRFTVLPES